MVSIVYQANLNNERFSQYRRLKLQLTSILQTCKSYCAICFDPDTDLMQFHDQVEIVHWEGTLLTPISNIMGTLFGQNESNIFGSQNVCVGCSKAAVSAYLFIYNTTRSSDIVRDYLDQLNTHVDDTNALVETSEVKQYDHTVLSLNDPVNIYDVKEDLTLVEEDDENLIKAEMLDDITESSPSNKLYCDHCMKQFSSKKGLTYHIHQTHPGLDNPRSRVRSKFDCTECEETECKHLKYLQALKEQRLAGLRTVTCPDIDCSYTCYWRSDLIMHANNKHLKIFSSTCEFCGKPLQSTKQYNYHILKFHTDLHNCLYCDRQFKVENNMLKHSKECQSSKRPYECQQCPASFLTMKKLRFHKMKHDAQFVFPCNLCSRVFRTTTVLEQHKDTTHNINLELTKTDNHEFSCFICHEKFLTQKERNNHMSNHDPNEKYKCLTCNLEYSTLMQYRYHRKSYAHLAKLHPGKRHKYKCKDCQYSTITTHLLEAHVNRYHMRVAPYACQQCPRKFLNSQRFEKHLLKHESETEPKIFVCEMCGNHFRSAVALMLHNRRHTGEKPYKCEFCDERFVSASTRSVHKLKSHSEKNFKCPICDHKTHTLANLRAHISKVHWKKKGEKFDIRKLEGVKEEDYELFRDRRFLNL